MAKKTNEELLKEKYVVQRTEKCPVCSSVFPLSDVRKTKVKIVNSDMDLRTYYEPVDPLYYDILMCDKCGYTADVLYFNKIKRVQKDLIIKQITPDFWPQATPEIYTPYTALNRLKQAYKCGLVKMARSSEIGYLFLKAAWVFRDIEQKGKEMLFLKGAVEEFQKAFTTEEFPICTMDSLTMKYLIAALLYQCEDYIGAQRWVADVVTSREAGPRLKNRAVNLKEDIRANLNQGSDES